MLSLVCTLFCAVGLFAKGIYGKATVIELGPYRFTELSEPGQSPQLEITRKSAPHKDHLPIWSTVKDYPFLRLGDATMSRPPILNGNYQLDETTKYISDTVTVDTIFEEETDQKVVIYGQLLAADMELIAHYTLTFQVTNLASKQIQFNVDIRPTDDCTTSIQNARSFLTYAAEPDENFYGFGESFSFFNLKGRRVPILVSEQGVGRGEQPITDYLNANVAQGVGGDWYTTYAPKPIYITNHNRTVLLNNSEVSFFDLTATEAGAGGTQALPRVQVEVWSLNLLGYLMQSTTMLGAVEAVTELTGRQKVLPAWTQEGAVVGLEGGTENVTRIVNSMYEAGVPMAGIWLQDWVGLQHSWDGDRLIWNWELNKDHYPGWDEMVSLWHSRGTRVLTYMSPFFSDPSAYSNSTTAFRNNFFQEGLEKGYFVQNANQTTYLMYSLSIKFAMLDLTNPAAVAWMQEIIIDQSVEEGHSSGWMCDFGEYLPFDAVLHSGESAASFHNRFPEEWGALTFRALEEAGRRRQARMEAGGASAGLQGEVISASTTSTGVTTLPPIDPADVVYFMRSAWIQSPRYAAVFWLGDQLVSWDSNDGLRSALTGALSSGLVGHAITHSDIGGYTVELGMPANMTYIRTPELLKRWSEFSAFGFGLYRTHIGSSTSPVDAQVYDSPESMAHFGRFAGVFAQLKEYRMELMQEAARTGHPLVRPLCLHYGYDEAVWGLTEQYLVGTQLLAAPVLYEGAVSVQVYFPKHSGTWVHIWSGNEVTAPADGLTLTVPAPIGFPPVFYQKGSVYGAQLRAYLLRAGYTQGYEWECAMCGGNGGISIGSGGGGGSGGDSTGSSGGVAGTGNGNVGETVTTHTNPAVPLVIIILLLALGMAVYYAYVYRRNNKGDVVSGGTVYERLSPSDEL